MAYPVPRPVNVFYLGSSVRTQPDMAVYADFIPLQFEADVFLLDQMVRFCTLRKTMHYILYHLNVYFCNNYIVNNNNK